MEIFSYSLSRHQKLATSTKITRLAINLALSKINLRQPEAKLFAIPENRYNSGFGSNSNDLPPAIVLLAQSYGLHL